MFTEQILTRGLLLGGGEAVNSLALGACSEDRRVGSHSKTEPPGKVTQRGSLATISNHLQQPLRGGPSGQHQKPVNCSWTLSAHQMPHSIGFRQDHNTSLHLTARPEALTRARGEGMQMSGVWGPPAWDPWGFTLWNNQDFRSVSP